MKTGRLKMVLALLIVFSVTGTTKKIQASPTVKSSETVLSDLLPRVTSSKTFEDYKSARGFGMMPTAPSLKSLEIQRISAEDPTNRPRAKGAPLYNYKVTATYLLKDKSICTLYLPFLLVAGEINFGVPSSDGCGE